MSYTPNKSIELRLGRFINHPTWGDFYYYPLVGFMKPNRYGCSKVPLGGGATKKTPKTNKQTNKMVFIAYESLPRSCQAHQERMFTTLTNMDGGNIGYCVGYRDCYYEPN